LLELSIEQDAFKTVSKRTTTQILDFIGDIGGFYGAVDLCVFLIAQYFSAQFFIQSISNSMFLRKKTELEIGEMLSEKNAKHAEEHKIE